VRYVLLSQRQESELDVSAWETPEDLAEYAANYIKRDVDSNYAHCIFSSWEELVEFAGSTVYHDDAENSVQYPGLYDDRQEDREAVLLAVRNMVADRLGTDSARHKKQLEMERRQKWLEQEAKRLEAERLKWEAERPEREARWKRELEEKKAKEVAELKRLAKLYPEALS
jgi:hypothetical protein